MEELTFERENEADEDEFQLFDKDFAQQIQRSLADLNPPVAASPEHDSGLWPDDVPYDSPDDLIGAEAAGPRPWDEVIPGIDPETKALYESWDEIYGGENEVPVSTLFDPPLQLPPADTVTTDEVAEPVLRMILARLAELNVALDMCEHCTPLSAYRILTNEILPIAEVHPNLAATNIVEHYCAYEFCPQCLAELDAEYEQYERERGQTEVRDKGQQEVDPAEADNPGTGDPR
jgi:hypothetical protein